MRNSKWNLHWIEGGWASSSATWAILPLHVKTLAMAPKIELFSSCTGWFLGKTYMEAEPEFELELELEVELELWFQTCPGPGRITGDFLVWFICKTGPVWLLCKDVCSSQVSIMWICWKVIKNRFCIVYQKD